MSKHLVLDLEVRLGVHFGGAFGGAFYSTKAPVEHRKRHGILAISGNLGNIRGGKLPAQHFNYTFLHIIMLLLINNLSVLSIWDMRVEHFKVSLRCLS